jgi:DNA-binding IclR family transcriptional regulator
VPSGCPEPPERRREDVVRVLRERAAQGQRGTSVRILCRALGVPSTETIHRVLVDLIARGVVVRSDARRHCIYELVED